MTAAPLDQPKGERRWPPALAIIVLIGIPLLLPVHIFPRLLFIATPFQIGLLIAIMIVDPGRIDRRSELLRGLSIALTALFAFVAIVATGWLVAELVRGAPDLRNPKTLLSTGALVWIYVNLTFSLLYWELDGGGSAARLQHPRTYPDLAFPQHMNPELAPPGWRSRYADYLYLGFTNATAFSPTDIMPLARWAKLLMTAEAILSIVILSLVIANAVNIIGS